MDKKMYLQPTLLFPTVPFYEIIPEKINETVDRLKTEGHLEPVRAVYFNSHYYIIFGHYNVLAYNILKRDRIPVIVMDKEDVLGWSTDSEIEENLESINLAYVYDFEGVGDFQYQDYPVYYRR